MGFGPMDGAFLKARVTEHWAGCGGPRLDSSPARAGGGRVNLLVFRRGLGGIGVFIRFWGPLVPGR